MLPVSEPAKSLLTSSLAPVSQHSEEVALPSAAASRRLCRWGQQEAGIARQGTFALQEQLADRSEAR